MTKLPNGSGSVRTIRRAGQLDRFQALGPRLAGGQRPSLGVYGTREEADGVRRAGVRQLVEEAGGARLRGATLRAFGERYLEGRAADVPRSIKTERSHWKKICAAPFADDPLDLVLTPQLQAFLVALARRLPGAAPGVKALLSGVFGAAAREGLVESNPVTSVRLPRRVRTHEPWTYLTLDEQRRLLAAAAEPMRLMLSVWLYTGLRPGEFGSLRLADVHLDRKAIVVRFGSLWGPCKGKRVRTVHLAPPAVAAMERWLEILPVFAPANRYGLVFPGELGGARLSGDVFRSRTGDGWRAALEAAGIVAEGRHDGRPVRCHDLRHTCAAALVSGMWGPPWRMEEVQQHLGHADIGQTQRYAHLAPGVVSDLVSRTAGVGHGLVTAPAPPAVKPARSRSGADDDGLHRVSLPRPQIGAKYPTGNPPAATLARAALEAVAAGDPHRELRLIEACEAVLAEEAAATAQPKRGRR